MSHWMILLGMIGGLTACSPWPGHVRMIVVAVAVFVVLKREMLRRFAERHAVPSRLQRTLWYTAWAGLDAEAFFLRRTTRQPGGADWCFAAGKFAFGIVMWGAVAPQFLPDHPMIAGWLAMIGMIFTLHFGGLHLLALSWRTGGLDVLPIMNAPILATSLSEFWGKRWNLAFRDFAHPCVFQPLARKTNASVATWISFVFSGLVHELAITIPAGGGYGLPTAYFLMQAVGVSLERQLLRRRNARWKSVLGWLLTVLFVAPGAVLLFPPEFVCRVVLPLIPEQGLST
ncbi:MAG: membrane bound O-acyl transferase family-domain-containing protein [Planctomycetaceae bacterium]|nr:membrane bound O-acyl transferase family-domain-containing protein [Planctomycetaceae bacterium]